jgi:hypothetical protein
MVYHNEQPRKVKSQKDWNETLYGIIYNKLQKLSEFKSGAGAGAEEKSANSYLKLNNLIEINMTYYRD